jgi:branched-chain amino acid transport system substrate-binding protein
VGSSLAGGSTMILVWAAWVNAHGGVNGHRVQVLTADDNADPSRHLALVRDMVESRHVLAFVGDQTPLTTSVSRGYLEQRGIPVIGGDNVTVDWTQSPMLFPTGTTLNELLDADLRIMHDAGKPKLAMVYCAEASTCTYQYHRIVQEGRAAAAGDQVVYSAQVSLTQPDFTAQCLGAKTAGAETVFTALDSNSLSRLGASCARQGYSPLYVTVAQAISNSLASNPALEGFTAGSPVFPWMIASTPETADYARAIQEYAPTLEMSGATAIAWTAGEVFKVAAAHIGVEPTTHDILQGLWAIRGDTFGGLTPPLTFVAHQPTPPVSCYFEIALRGGRWTAPHGDAVLC